MPLTSNNIEIDFGSSSYGMILNNQAEGLISFKIYLDKLIQSTKNSSNITNFSDSKSQKASFSFGIFKNLKYEGYLKDLSGNLVLNPNAKPKIVMLQIPSKAITNPEYSCCEDGSEAQIFLDALIEFNKYATLFDSTFEWGVKELRNLSPDKVIQEYIDMTPLGRLETPEDVADVVTFLASENSRFMTGQSINVTGGIYTT